MSGWFEALDAAGRKWNDTARLLGSYPNGRRGSCGEGAGCDGMVPQSQYGLCGRFRGLEKNALEIISA